MKQYNITHYLNKRLKPSFVNGVPTHPVYIRVSHGRKNERVKSVWIVHPCSENDFSNNQHILELIKYESEIITDILQNAKNNDFNLSARLNNSIIEVTSIYLDTMFDKNEIKEQIINYISHKVNLSTSIFKPFIKPDYLNNKELKELTEKNIFNKETNDKVKYLYLLKEFENEQYNQKENNDFGYRAGCIFVPHEWKKYNKNEEFLKFAQNKHILDKKDLNIITKLFEHNLHNTSKLDTPTYK